MNILIALKCSNVNRCDADKINCPKLLGWSLPNRHFSVGGLPKELGDLINLKSFDVSANSIGGQLSIRTERLNVRD